MSRKFPVNFLELSWTFRGNLPDIFRACFGHFPEFFRKLDCSVSNVWVFLRRLESLNAFKRSGKLVGSISTCPRTYKSPWCRVMTKNSTTKDIKILGLGDVFSKFFRPGSKQLHFLTSDSDSSSKTVYVATWLCLESQNLEGKKKGARDTRIFL